MVYFRALGSTAVSEQYANKISLNNVLQAVTIARNAGLKTPSVSRSLGSFRSAIPERRSGLPDLIKNDSQVAQTTLIRRIAIAKRTRIFTNKSIC